MFSNAKSEREIDRLRRSADVVSRCLGAVAKEVGPGVTTRQLDRVAEAFLKAEGARPAFKGYDPGWGGGAFPATCCISVNDVVVHGIPNDVPLQEGDLVTVDVGCELDGYFGDTAYTFAVGEISDEQRRLLRVTYESLMLGAEQAVAGRRLGDIGHAVQAHCESAGYGVVRELVGHGIGRKLHEKPSVQNYGRRGHGQKLTENLVLCIEPMIAGGTYEVTHGADKWAVHTADGAPSAHYEHMVVVRRGRAEILTSYDPVEAVIAPPYAAPAAA
jgi:methionyl aminopeptidase